MPHYDYGIPPETFAAAWQLSENLTEAHGRLAAIAKAIGRKPMPKPIMMARAARYRKQGRPLKKFPPGPRPRPRSTYDAVKELIDKINRREITDVPFLVPRTGDNVQPPTPPDPPSS